MRKYIYIVDENFPPDVLLKSSKILFAKISCALDIQLTIYSNKIKLRYRLHVWWNGERHFSIYSKYLCQVSLLITPRELKPGFMAILWHLVWPTVTPYKGHYTEGAFRSKSCQDLSGANSPYQSTYKPQNGSEGQWGRCSQSGWMQESSLEYQQLSTADWTLDMWNDWTPEPDLTQAPVLLQSLSCWWAWQTLRPCSVQRCTHHSKNHSH